MGSRFCRTCAKDAYANEGEARLALGSVRARREGKRSAVTSHRRSRTSAKRFPKRGKKSSGERNAYGPCPEGWWHLTSH